MELKTLQIVQSVKNFQMLTKKLKAWKFSEKFSAYGVYYEDDRKDYNKYLDLPYITRCLVFTRDNYDYVATRFQI